MNKHATSDIRNIAFLGGPATGKATFAEALLRATWVIGVLRRMGLASDGTTVSDFRDDEKTNSIR